MKPRFALGLFASVLVAGNACALGKEAQEFVMIQGKMAPDQCELQLLSTQAAAAQRSGDQGRRQELKTRIETVVKRLQANQPRIHELARYVQMPAPDYQEVMQRTAELRAKCKP